MRVRERINHFRFRNYTHSPSNNMFIMIIIISSLTRQRRVLQNVCYTYIHINYFTYRYKFLTISWLIRVYLVAQSPWRFLEENCHEVGDGKSIRAEPAACKWILETNRSGHCVTTTAVLFSDQNLCILLNL